MAIPNLQTAAVGSPITRMGVSFFPIYLHGNDLPAISTGERSGLKINELDNADVQQLRVGNPTDKPILIVEGEHFLGGKQNRAVNVSVLVPSLSDIEIPVSCLERGRWGAPKGWQRAASFEPANVRARKRSGVSASMLREGSRRGNQSEVWNAVDLELSREDVSSGTSAAADLEGTYRRDSSRRSTVEQLVELGPLPGQCGVAVARGGELREIDVFGAPNLLAAHWGRIVRSHFFEPATTKFPPSATRVLAYLQRIGLAADQQSSAVGLGTEHRHVEPNSSGQALSLNGAIVHASFSKR